MKSNKILCDSQHFEGKNRFGMSVKKFHKNILFLNPSIITVLIKWSTPVWNCIVSSNFAHFAAAFLCVPCLEVPGQQIIKLWNKNMEFAVFLSILHILSKRVNFALFINKMRNYHGPLYGQTTIFMILYVHFYTRSVDNDPHPRTLNIWTFWNGRRDINFLQCWFLGNICNCQELLFLV